MTKLIVWFRNDLRLHDNEALWRACQKNAEILPIYCFDIRQFQNTVLGFPKTDSLRAKFLIESVADLRANLQKIGSDLVIRVGYPEEIIPELAQKWQATAVLATKETTAEELAVEKKLEAQLWQAKIPLNLFWGATLYHLEDLPFPINNLPDIFTQFRKNVEGQIQPRVCFECPLGLPKIAGIAPGKIPNLEDLGLKNVKNHAKNGFNFVGGETQGLLRLQNYIWETESIKNYKETRNGLLGLNYSSKFSPWLALGCLSARKIYAEIKAFEVQKVKNDSTYWLIFELLWRDYFRFVARKYGDRIFKLEGIKNFSELSLSENHKTFSLWAEGKTGVPFIDANMRELNQTGYMSNRGRQNVASFLVKDLKINWLWGAMYFESKLIDYDVCSNYGNWTYIAGVGNDPRENRYFNIISQAKRYDQKGEYVKYWLPELSQLPSQVVHHPQLNMEEQQQFKLQLGLDYPNSLVNFAKWL
jgi:deoxyribodipyrimidine photo-lyase